jgi:hypothetical protein
MDNLDFPRTINMFELTKYLNRELNMEEKCLFNSVKMEKLMNIQLNKINETIKSRNLEISHASVIDGNCLFDSLSSLGYGDNSDELRKSITYLMYIFKDYKNFFTDQQESLNELFANFNEIELVYCKNNSKVYKYSFDVMCQDMYESCNWTRLNTQLVLMFISKVFNINITIIHDNGFETTIHLGDENSKNVFLAHVGESHYLPISKIEDMDNLKNIEYKHMKHDFLKWATKQSLLKNMKEKEEKQKQIQNIFDIKDHKKDTKEYKEMEINDENIKNL